MTPQQYCKDKTKQSGSSFTISFIFLDKERRQAMTALYAFCREVDDVVDECTDYEVAQTKLNWWKQEIHNLYDNKPNHPVSFALAPFIQPFNLSKEHFLEIIDGMEMDLQFNRYADFTQLQLYCYRVASVVGLLSAQIFGFSNRATLKYAHDLGIAFQLTNILRDVREDAGMGRVYLPNEDLDRFGASIEPGVEPAWNAEFRSLAEFEWKRAAAYYEEARPLLGLVERDSRPALWALIAIYRGLLERIREQDYDVLSRRARLTTAEKLKIVARAMWSRWRGGTPPFPG